MTLAIRLNAYIICHLTSVMLLHYLLLHKKTKLDNDELKQRLIDTWDSIPQDIIDKPSDQWQT